jgi:hypothetical protein
VTVVAGRMRGWFRCLFATSALACGEDTDPSAPPGPPPSPKQTVRFEYRASTEADLEVFEGRRSCFLSVGRTHLHMSWHGFELAPFAPLGEDLWVLSRDDVPVGEHRIRVSDANACLVNPTGAVEAEVVFANDVKLTRHVDTPGTGTEPGFAFAVHADGTVTP